MPQSDQSVYDRFEEELERAELAQRVLLPRLPLTVSGYEFFAYYKPAFKIGGDHLDFVEMTDGRIAAIILDVAGKGVPAALLKAWVSGAFRAYLQYETDPATVLRTLNTSISKTGGDRFVTMAIAVLDPSKHTVTVVNAGHPPPLLFRCHSGISNPSPDHTAGPPLGILEEVEYDCYQLGLQPGECLILFTDGVPDAQNVEGERLGIDGLVTAVYKDYPYSPHMLGETLITAVVNCTLNCKQFDDIALVCFGRVV
jgi:serine phosphatase RsbU (regulator of sigma subunit)